MMGLQELFTSAKLSKIILSIQFMYLRIMNKVSQAVSFRSSGLAH